MSTPHRRTMPPRGADTARRRRAADGRSRTLLRRAAVTVAFLAAMVGTAVGVGAFGGDPIEEAAGGLLAADSTHLAPASSAFSIWTLIYVGLGAYTLWQWGILATTAGSPCRPSPPCCSTPPGSS